MNDSKHITFDSENLAVPEVHTNETKTKDDNDKASKGSIIYDDLAIPELQIKPKKNKQ